MEIMRAEHPKPQFSRNNWMNLNGPWQFEFDQSNSAIERKLYEDSATLSQIINVPFCPESELSGIGYKDFIHGAVYKRTFELSKADLSGCVRLHFGAVDYEAAVYVNEKPVGNHKGGYVSFFFDITDQVKPGTNTVTVIVKDDTRNPMIPSGKQSTQLDSYSCFYTRTTGIWQTVWLEFLPKAHLESVKYFPNIHDCSITIEAEVVGAGTLSANITFDGRPMGSYTGAANGGQITFTIPLSEKHLWQVGQGNLYNITFRYGEDIVESYFGLRQVRLDGYRFLINEESVFQRLVLDQGFYPDGIYTARSDEILKRDIELSLAVGFNGARLHEKVFEERFLYHCDKLGYLVWGEYPNWGLDHSRPESLYAILPEWMEEVKRDFNHPSIIGWCPFNETWPCEGRKQFDGVLATVYDVTKAMDTTRPCIDTSGNFHVKTDIFDVHDYCQDPETYKQRYDKLVEDGVLAHDNLSHWASTITQTYTGGPTFVSEYGGIRWTNDQNGWGYGQGPKTPEEFIARFKGLTEVLLQNRCMFGFCYTQLTDVEQEQNGIYDYYRNAKFPPEIFREIMTQKAAIED